jgi:hypothetical protein
LLPSATAGKRIEEKAGEDSPGPLHLCSWPTPSVSSPRPVLRERVRVRAFLSGVSNTALTPALSQSTGRGRRRSDNLPPRAHRAIVAMIVLADLNCHACPPRHLQPRPPAGGTATALVALAHAQMDDGPPYYIFVDRQMNRIMRNAILRPGGDRL